MKSKKNSAAEDQELVKRSLKGEHEAFSDLVRRYQKRVYGLTYGMLGNREDALDVTQEAFLKAFRSLQGFRGGAAFYTWIYRIAYNLSIDFRRREWKKKHIEYDDGYSQADKETVISHPSPSFHPGQGLAQKELNQVITRAIQELPEQHRAVILLREVEGLSYDQIAKTLRIRKGTVMSRLHYARQKLQEMLTPYIKEGEIHEE